jgi:hypothetical protein
MVALEVQNQAIWEADHKCRLRGLHFATHGAIPFVVLVELIGGEEIADARRNIALRLRDVQRNNSRRAEFERALVAFVTLETFGIVPLEQLGDNIGARAFFEVGLQTVQQGAEPFIDIVLVLDEELGRKQREDLIETLPYQRLVVLPHAVIYVAIGVDNRTAGLSALPYAPPFNEGFEKVKALESTVSMAQDVRIG